MGYETWSNHMVAMQFVNAEHAGVYLLRGFQRTLLKKLGVTKKEVQTWLDSDDFDPGDMYSKFGCDGDDVCRACGLSFEYEGDARSYVPHGYLGLSFSSMKDTETKRKFISRVNKTIEKFSKQKSDATEVSFSYTC